MYTESANTARVMARTPAYQSVRRSLTLCRNWFTVRQAQAVPCPAHCLKEPRIALVVQFGAQTPYVDVDDVRKTVVICVPGVFHQLVPPDHLAGPARHIFQNTVLGVGQ